MARPDRIRHQFYLSRELTERFEAVASQPGVCKSFILEEAVTQFIERKGDAELELHFAHRLDRLSNQLGRVTKNSEVVRESLILFIRFALVSSVPYLKNDDESRAMGLQYFADFFERVREVLARAGISFDPGTVQ